MLECQYLYALSGSDSSMLVFSGELQRQIRRVQEEVGRWNNGIEIAGQNQGQREAPRQGSRSKDELGYLFFKIYHKKGFCFFLYIFVIIDFNAV